MADYRQTGEGGGPNQVENAVAYFNSQNVCFGVVSLGFGGGGGISLDSQGRGLPSNKGFVHARFLCVGASISFSRGIPLSDVLKIAKSGHRRKRGPAFWGVLALQALFVESSLSKYAKTTRNVYVTSTWGGPLYFVKGATSSKMVIC